MISNQKVRLTCFETEYLENYDDSDFNNLNISKGHHIDDINHRWIFLHEFILLPYSYMTFAIKQKLQELKCYDHPDFIFDIEQFNFIFDKRTTFTLDPKACLNIQYMQFLLSNMEQFDPKLLDLL